MFTVRFLFNALSVNVRRLCEHSQDILLKTKLSHIPLSNPITSTEQSSTHTQNSAVVIQT